MPPEPKNRTSKRAERYTDAAWLKGSDDTTGLRIGLVLGSNEPRQTGDFVDPNRSENPDAGPEEHVLTAVTFPTRCFVLMCHVAILPACPGA